MIPVLPLVLLGLAGVVPGSDPLKVGIWMETAQGFDSARSRSWAKDLVESLNHRMYASGLALQASLSELHFVPPGSLPLAGGDARHHPDLRSTSLDLVWGVRRQDSLPESATNALRTWLVNAGCLDERGFAVGWDVFLLPRRLENRLDPSRFPLDGSSIRQPPWALLSDTILPLACRRSLQALRTGRGPLYSDAGRLKHQTDSSLSRPLAVSALDAVGHPASGATLEIWRGRPDARRPYASLFEGAPDIFLANDSGRFPFSTPKALLCGSLPWIHDRTGSCGTCFWRLRHAHRELSGWLDAGILLGLPDSLDTLSLSWILPGGSSMAWKDASDHWPHPWLAAESDTSGTLTLGISVPIPTEYVLRIIDDMGREAMRSRPMSFSPGIYEKRLEGMSVKSNWDVRLDAPSSRLQTRIRTH